MKCTNDSLAVLNTSVIGTPAVNSSQLVAIIRNWSIGKPSIVVKGLTLQIESVCNIVSGCFQPIPTASFSPNIQTSLPLYSGVGGALGILVILVAIVLVAIVICRIKMSQLKRYINGNVHVSFKYYKKIINCSEEDVEIKQNNQLEVKVREDEQRGNKTDTPKMYYEIPIDTSTHYYEELYFEMDEKPPNNDPIHDYI